MRLREDHLFDKEWGRRECVAKSARTNFERLQLFSKYMYRSQPCDFYSLNTFGNNLVQNAIVYGVWHFYGDHILTSDTSVSEKWRMYLYICVASAKYDQRFHSAPFNIFEFGKLKAFGHPVESC